MLQQAAPGHVQAVRVNYVDDISRLVNDRIGSLSLDRNTCAKTGATL